MTAAVLPIPIPVPAPAAAVGALRVGLVGAEEDVARVLFQSERGDGLFQGRVERRGLAGHVGVRAY